MGTTAHQLAYAYEAATNPLFPVLSRLGWGELVNLGYYTPRTLPRLADGLAPFQRELVSRSLGLLDPRPGEDVLDVACGTGYTTRRIADHGATVTGIDLYPSHLAQAAQRHEAHPRVRFLQADATDLRATATGTGTAERVNASFHDDAFDKVHCLEAAFHFGPDGRRAFMEDAYRLLRPGGRLVVVDFAWAGDEPGEIRAADPKRVVRDTWSFEEFEPLSRYARHALDIGYGPCRLHDWTRPVTRRFMALGRTLAQLALTDGGRSGLCHLRPSLHQLTTPQWLTFSATALAHLPVQRASRYIALVLDKSVTAGTRPSRRRSG